MNNNQVQTKPTNQVSQMTTFLSSNAVKNKVNAIVGAKEGDKLISNLVSNIQQNPTLAECTQGSIINGALAGHALKLDFALQQAYLVPFNDNKTDQKNAQFCIGWKGYVQLALRSGQYRFLNVKELKEGELIDFDELTEEYEIKWIKDKVERNKKPTTHYIAIFELINGFRKSIIWTKDEMEIHARTYSSAYQYDLKKGYKNSWWSKDFDNQAKKTMIRQIISKFGVMSTEMQTAYTQDMGVIDENGNPTYVDNAENNIKVDAEVIEEYEERINDDQVQALCQKIISKGLNVNEFFEKHEITNVTQITVTQYTELLKELA